MASSLAAPNASANNEIHCQAEGMDLDHHHDGNVLRKHVAFFDQNNDGIIYPWETFRGFREIGCGILLSSVAALFINMGLSAKTRPGKSFSLLFPIEIKNIQMAKHGSDSGVYDTEGRFVNSKFEEIFAKHANSNSSALTSDELTGLLKSNREPKDYKGWLASYTEWKMLYILCKDENGLLHKDAVRGVYDGSLFERMAKMRELQLSNKKSA
ncbi:probable peroxygenase 4 isoform X1 [Daucus carota subsp. sativus]|uniref:probable peroxygenase 4 isoform X1 n=1 Tax=Daucus carota subsp. sativus TaxID=79200 RepID=UPI0007B19A8C|nr:PREDICTED: probable peroxygenase 4 isoform X1 [Daucus carota subsp. sativus]